MGTHRGLKYRYIICEQQKHRQLRHVHKPPYTNSVGSLSVISPSPLTATQNLQLEANPNSKAHSEIQSETISPCPQQSGCGPRAPQEGTKPLHLPLSPTHHPEERKRRQSHWDSPCTRHAQVHANVGQDMHSGVLLRGCVGAGRHPLFTSPDCHLLFVLMAGETGARASLSGTQPKNSGPGREWGPKPMGLLISTRQGDSAWMPNS